MLSVLLVRHVCYGICLLAAGCTAVQWRDTGGRLRTVGLALESKGSMPGGTVHKHTAFGVLLSIDPRSTRVTLGVDRRIEEWCEVRTVDRDELLNDVLQATSGEELRSGGEEMQICFESNRTIGCVLGFSAMHAGASIGYLATSRPAPEALNGDVVLYRRESVGGHAPCTYLWRIEETDERDAN